MYPQHPNPAGQGQPGNAPSGPYGAPGPDQGAPGWQPPSAAQQKKSPLPLIGLIAGLALLLGGGITSLIMFTKDSPASTAQGAAEQFVKAFNDRDLQTLNGMLCLGSRIQQSDFERERNKDAKMVLLRVRTINDDQAVATFTVDVGTDSSGGELLMSRTDGGWTLCEERVARLTSLSTPSRTTG